MKYQFIKLNDNSKCERIEGIECQTRADALEKMSKKAKEAESILYLIYYDENYPDWHDMVIATATHTSEIINY